MSGATQRSLAPAASESADPIGERLRAVRQDRGMSLAALAGLSGVPASTISKIENGLLNPSLVHAINLASALDENLGFLVSNGSAPAPLSVTRAGERSQLAYPEMSLTLEDLNGPSARGLLEARIGIIDPGAHSGAETMRHPGEELCHVLEGRLRYELEDGPVVLAAGDTLHFKCSRPHRWVNEADGRTVVLWVFSDGLSF